MRMLVVSLVLSVSSCSQVPSSTLVGISYPPVGPPTLVQIDPATGSFTTLGVADQNVGSTATVDHATQTFYADGLNGTLTLDVTSGSLVSNPTVSVAPMMVAFDRVTGRLLGMVPNAVGFSLAVIDPATSLATPLGVPGALPFPSDVAFDPAARIYYILENTSLWRVDADTGLVLGTAPLAFPAPMAIAVDALTGTLRGASLTLVPGITWVALDPATGVSTTLSNFTPSASPFSGATVFDLANSRSSILAGGPAGTRSSPSTT